MIPYIDTNFLLNANIASEFWLYPNQILYRKFSRVLWKVLLALWTQWLRPKKRLQQKFVLQRVIWDVKYVTNSSLGKITLIVTRWSTLEPGHTHAMNVVRISHVAIICVDIWWSIQGTNLTCVMYAIKNFLGTNIWIDTCWPIRVIDPFIVKNAEKASSVTRGWLSTWGHMKGVNYRSEINLMDFFLLWQSWKTSYL